MFDSSIIALSLAALSATSPSTVALSPAMVIAATGPTAFMRLTSAVALRAQASGATPPSIVSLSTTLVSP